MNTIINYQYRDASNYKQNEAVIVIGEITFTDIKDCLEDGENFIPSQVGLENLQPRMESFPSEDDHVWHELVEGDFETTDKPATVIVTAHELKEHFKDAKRHGWDIGHAMQKLGL